MSGNERSRPPISYLNEKPPVPVQTPEGFSGPVYNLIDRRRLEREFGVLSIVQGALNDPNDPLQVLLSLPEPVLNSTTTLAKQSDIQTFNNVMYAHFEPLLLQQMHKGETDPKELLEYLKEIRISPEQIFSSIRTTRHSGLLYRVDHIWYQRVLDGLQRGAVRPSFDVHSIFTYPPSVVGYRILCEES